MEQLNSPVVFLGEQAMCGSVPAKTAGRDQMDDVVLWNHPE